MALMLCVSEKNDIGRLKSNSSDIKVLITTT